VEIAAMTPFHKAYVEAGYRGTVWAKYNASRLANTPEVAARIDELQAEFRKTSQLRAE
jgi:phage terminase small subunit